MNRNTLLETLQTAALEIAQCKIGRSQLSL